MEKTPWRWHHLAAEASDRARRLAAQLEILRVEHSEIAGHFEVLSDAFDALVGDETSVCVVELCERVTRETIEHFPHEETLFGQLLCEDAEASVALLEEHRLLRELARAIDTRARDARRAAPDDLAPLIRDSRRLCAAMLRHLSTEQAAIFPKLDSALRRESRHWSRR